MGDCQHQWRLAHEEKLLHERHPMPDEQTLGGVKLVLRHEGWRRRWYCIWCRAFETREEPLDPGENE